MPKKLPLYQKFLLNNGPIVDRGNFSKQIGQNQFNIDNQLAALKNVKTLEKEDEKKRLVENYKNAKLFHEYNPVRRVISSKREPTLVKPTTRQILNGLGSGIEDFYRVPKLGELNEWINPLYLASSGIIAPWAQAPQQAVESNSSLPYGLAALSTAVTAPFIKPSMTVPKKALNLPRKVGQVYRDIKYPENIIFKDGKKFYNSYDFLKNNNFNNQGLSKQELKFLNQELQDRGVLEFQRRHPLDPRQIISSKSIVPVNYSLKEKVNEFFPNLLSPFKKEQPLGPIRENAFRQYLGIPTKNTVYRIHEKSFRNNDGLLYTIPENLLNAKNNPLGDKMDLYNFNLFNSIEKGYKRPTQKNLENLYNNLNDFYRNTPELANSATIGDFFKSKMNSVIGMPSFMENGVTRIPIDDFLTRTAGNTSLLKRGNRITMRDTWDINPFKTMKRLPRFLRNADLAPILGGKNFTLVQDYVKKGDNVKQMFIPRN